MTDFGMPLFQYALFDQNRNQSEVVSWVSSEVDVLFEELEEMKKHYQPSKPFMPNICSRHRQYLHKEGYELSVSSGRH